MNKFNKQNKIKLAKLSLLTLLSLSFSACGGGGDSSSFENSETITDITTVCVTTPTSTDISSYITLNSEDVIIKDSNDAVISIYHDTDGTKKVCLVSGTAHIVQQ